MNNIEMASTQLALKLEEIATTNTPFQERIYALFRHEGAPLALCVVPPDSQGISFLVLYAFRGNVSVDQIKDVLSKAFSNYDVTFAQVALQGSALNIEGIQTYLKDSKQFLSAFKNALDSAQQGLENH